jgi:large conductance mechanosensitive channel
MLQEFKDFAMKGNVVDMGVGIVIGAAFTSIVTSFVEDIINPFVSLFTGGVDFSNLFVNLTDQDVTSAAKAKEDGLAVITYGNFLMALMSFLIVAFVLFMIVKAVNSAKKAEEEAPEPDPEPTAEETLLGEIRDLLAKQG